MPPWWCWCFGHLCSQGAIFLPGNKVLEHPCNEESPGKFLFEVIPGKIIFWLIALLLFYIGRGENKSDRLYSWLSPLIWGGKYQIWFIFTEIMIPGISTWYKWTLPPPTHTHKCMATWLLEGYPSVQRLQSDQKSWYNITKTLLETSWLYSAVAIWKALRDITGRMHCQLIYCHNFLIKWHCKEAFAIKRKEKNSFNNWQNVSVLYLNFVPNEPLPYVWLVKLRIPLPSYQILQLNFFNICSFFFLVICIHPSQSTWFSLRPLTHPATISLRPLSTFWINLFTFP